MHSHTDLKTTLEIYFKHTVKNKKRHCKRLLQYRSYGWLPVRRHLP